MIEFGFSDEQILSIFLLVMGDDNSGFTHLSLPSLSCFIRWLEEYALSRYGMVLSKTKSVITNDRGSIETLSYQCNYGMPIRPLGKLVAQLCYPERGPRPKYTSARAIGLAYAACGMDNTFHNLCRDVYYEFLDDAILPENEDLFIVIQPYLPGYMKADENLRNSISLTEFPSIYQVRQHVMHWQGPLSFYPKWDKSNFINPPDHPYPHIMTMADYRSENNLSRSEVPDLWSDMV